MAVVHMFTKEVEGKQIDFKIENEKLTAVYRLGQEALRIQDPAKAPNPEQCFQALEESRMFFQNGSLHILPRGCGGAGGKEEVQEIPSEYFCPITHQLMYDPVIAADGETYEREAIERHLQSSNDSPLHGAALENKMLIPNRALQRTISSFRLKMPTASEELYLPSKLVEECQVALLAENVALVKNQTQKEPRLFQHKFEGNQTLLDVALKTSPATVEAVLKLYPLTDKPELTDKLCARAAKSQGAEGLRILLSHYPASTSLNDRLFKALEHSAIDYLKALLKLGGDVNAHNAEGKTTLHAAVDADNKALLSILIQNGANIKMLDNNNLSAIGYAVKANKPHLANHIVFQHRQMKVIPHLTPLQKQVDQLMAMQLATLQAVQRISDKLDPKAYEPVRGELNALQEQLSRIMAKPTFDQPKPDPQVRSVQPIDANQVKQSDIIELLNQNFQNLETIIRLHKDNDLRINGPKEQAVILHYSIAGLLMRLFHLLGIANNQRQLPPLFNDQNHPFTRPTAYEYRGQLMHHLFKFRGCTLVLIKTAEQLQSIGANVKSLKNTGQPSVDPLLELSDLSIHKIARITEGVEDVVGDQLRAVEEIDQYALELSILNQRAQVLRNTGAPLWEHAGILHLAIGTLCCALGQRLRDIAAYPAYQTIKNKLISFDSQALETTTIGNHTQTATVFEIDRVRFGHTYNDEGLAPGQASAKALRQAAFELITPNKLLQRMALASQLVKEHPNRQEPLPLFFQETNTSFGSLNRQLQSLNFMSRPAEEQNTGGSSVGRELGVEQVCEPRPAQALGAEAWAHLGDVGEEPPLPKGINAILAEPCPEALGLEKYGKTIGETHILVLVPATLNGHSLTLGLFKMFLEDVQQKNRRGPKFTWWSPGGCENTCSPFSYWTLISKDCIKDSRSKAYGQQKEMISELGELYSLPKVVEMAFGLYLQDSTYRKNLYSDYWARCEESSSEGYPVA
ncbi:MAG TPA: hypothetical protein PLO43_00920, partial [Chlamydiales bacterium]|nr:hypothetical protein [Chlamydiales bacterium]